MEFVSSMVWTSRKIALQFPDELLVNSVEVLEKLQNCTKQKLFVLGDTSYGSCCVDEIAAQRYNADCLIHFGRSCLSKTSRLPVLNIYGQHKIDVDNCFCEVNRLLPDTDIHVIILFDTIYRHCVGDLLHKLQKSYRSVILSAIQETSNVNGNIDTSERNGVCRCHRMFHLIEETTLKDYSMFYVGRESQTLSNLMMNFTENSFYSYDPVSQKGRHEEININKTLMKRFYMIERVKDANIVGIVVGTLGVINYLEIISKIKKLLKSAGKKHYTFVVGKLNVAKLGNFMEVDVFVLVSCCENTLVDCKEFYKPIVTPYDLEIACNGNTQWTGQYTTDYTQLLPGSTSYVPVSPDKDNTVVDVSMVTNKLRTIGYIERDCVNAEHREISETVNKTITSQAISAGQFLAEKSWRGLEPNLGETAVVRATDGLKGIAMEYSNEPNC
ncbi:2-(3-amino-3-carboxypropyl)histidine synthase subunit 2 isoform X2 [Patella vulgata]|uniref:2-(3-amino-3-carboxypropyl)histidine synthase subunit 2 isoform X2 n=1 Tax=Patella vulgata TaxID=6465 RepID=UPI00217F45A8|nr:2-(3-amino-3-carboxypropyl)histidine synthase subunit 2 isoform X2 [Patella vulgata]